MGAFVRLEGSDIVFGGGFRIGKDSTKFEMLFTRIESRFCNEAKT